MRIKARPTDRPGHTHTSERRVQAVDVNYTAAFIFLYLRQLSRDLCQIRHRREVLLADRTERKYALGIDSPQFARNN